MARTTVTLENLENLQVDEANRLYWQGERIITDVMIDFPTWVDWTLAVGTIVIAGSTAVMMVVRILEYFGISPDRSES